MTGKSIDELLDLLNQVMRICIETTSRSAALESLLIDKGFVTAEELNARIQRDAEATKKFAEALDAEKKHEA